MLQFGELYWFRACSASDEIVSAYAQCAVKLFQLLLSTHSDVHVKTVEILTLAEHMHNLFGVCSVYDEIVSAYAQCAIKSFPRMLSMPML